MSLRPNRRQLALLAAFCVVVVIFAVDMVSSHLPAASFCDAGGAGSNASTAIHAYLSTCGSDYSIARGPYDADKATSAYADYAQVVEYSIAVKDNREGGLAFLMVGQKNAGNRWRTLGPPGTGP